MDPIAQILAQQSSGSAEGQGFGNFYVQGRQLNLSQQHLDLAKKAEARAQAEQDALLPVQRQLLENQAILQGANLGTIETASKVKAEMAMAMPQINDLQYKFTKDPNGYASDDNYNEWLKFQSKYPWAGHTQNGSEIDLGFKSVHMRSLQALELKKADLAGARGFNYATPEGRAAYNKQAAFDEVQRLAASPEYQRSFDASKMVPGWYDPDTGHYDPEKVAVSLQQMPRSEAMQSREEMNAAKMAATIEMLQFKIDHGGGFTPGAMEKDIRFFDSEVASGKMSQEDADKAKKVREFIEPKPAVSKIVNQADYIDKHIDHLMSQDPRLKRDQARELLKKEWEKDYGSMPIQGSKKIPTYDPITNTLK